MSEFQLIVCLFRSECLKRATRQYGTQMFHSIQFSLNRKKKQELEKLCICTSVCEVCVWLYGWANLTGAKNHLSHVLCVCMCVWARLAMLRFIGLFYTALWMLYSSSLFFLFSFFSITHTNTCTQTDRHIQRNRYPKCKTFDWIELDWMWTTNLFFTLASRCVYGVCHYFSLLSHALCHKCKQAAESNIILAHSKYTHI